MHKILLGVSAVAAAAVAPQAASAATYALTFQSGVAFATPAPTLAPGNGLTDTFTFTTIMPMTFSGTFSTQRLRVPAGTGPIVSDLDFVSVVLNNTFAFQIPTAGTDTFEQARLPSTDIGAGDHTIVVTYNVSDASALNGAAYSGTLQLGAIAGVPEPATWAMMIAGFGLVGASARRRRHVVARAAA